MKDTVEYKDDCEYFKAQNRETVEGLFYLAKFVLYGLAFYGAFVLAILMGFYLFMSLLYTVGFVFDDASDLQDAFMLKWGLCPSRHGFAHVWYWPVFWVFAIWLPIFLYRVGFRYFKGMFACMKGVIHE